MYSYSLPNLYCQFNGSLKMLRKVFRLLKDIQHQFAADYSVEPYIQDPLYDHFKNSLILNARKPQYIELKHNKLLAKTQQGDQRVKNFDNKQILNRRQYNYQNLSNHLLPKSAFQEFFPQALHPLDNRKPKSPKYLKLSKLTS
ncbi:hypothetical protein FGO68_gene11736 [Halteria grandinella]|uniref:Uncharacterized protein n=1 Tax=Halteria grandinella TaxID=5974 RepID=A0A8J8N9A8_HALGN|nr:hypothetical protein FGO68_gene11736 [Halteria grandinella]